MPFTPDVGLCRHTSAYHATPFDFFSTTRRLLLMIILMRLLRHVCAMVFTAQQCRDAVVCRHVKMLRRRC